MDEEQRKHLKKAYWHIAELENSFEKPSRLYMNVKAMRMRLQRWKD